VQRERNRLIEIEIDSAALPRTEWSEWLSDIEGKAERVAASERGRRASFKRRACGLCKPQKQGWADKKTLTDVRRAIAHEQQVRDWEKESVGADR
jgi:hypothetical protein